jgi:hypothetical protein
MDISRLLIIGLTATTLCACATSTPYLDSRFGTAVNTARALQTMNPEASRNRDPVAGIDGNSAKDSIDRYHESFKAPPRTFEVLLSTSGSR